MGACLSSGNVDAPANVRVDSVLKSAKKEYGNGIRILLLGTGGSGKSTVFKQMQILYDHGFTEEQRNRYKAVIRQNAAMHFAKLCVMATEQKNNPGFTSEEQPLVEKVMKLTNEADSSLEVTAEIFSDVAKVIEELWNVHRSPALEAVYRTQKEVSDNFVFFFKKVKHVSADSYNPTDDDILRSRMPTTGIVEKTFDMKTGADTGKFTMIDVGGQRSERRKWIQAFDDVTSILFVTAVNEFNANLEEDPDTNATKESLEVFKQITSRKYTGLKNYILFLNKYDLFLQKINSGVDFSESFPEYTGPNEPEPILEFITKQYVTMIPFEYAKKQTYIHATTATDTSLIQKIWGDTVVSFVAHSLEGAGIGV